MLSNVALSTWKYLPPSSQCARTRLKFPTPWQFLPTDLVKIPLARFRQVELSPPTGLAPALQIHLGDCLDPRLAPGDWLGLEIYRQSECTPLELTEDASQVKKKMNQSGKHFHCNIMGLTTWYGKENPWRCNYLRGDSKWPQRPKAQSLVHPSSTS